MGYFTWTLANRKPVMNSDGTDYLSRCVLPYGGLATVVCPDDTVITELRYDGYGMFGGKDIYDLAADWNRDHIPEIIQKPGFVKWLLADDDFMEMVMAYAARDDERLEQAIRKAAVKYPFLAEEWKRNIGIFLAAENNHLLTYPIKITDNIRPKKYAQLRPSILTQ